MSVTVTISVDDLALVEATARASATRYIESQADKYADATDPPQPGIAPILRALASDIATGLDLA